MKLRMTNEEIKEFSQWLRLNQPVMITTEDVELTNYWELFAYRIIMKLGL